MKKKIWPIYRVLNSKIKSQKSIKGPTVLLLKKRKIFDATICNHPTYTILPNNVLVLPCNNLKCASISKK